MFQRDRQKTVTSLLGKVVYHGCDCDGGRYPTDEQLGLSQSVTPGAAEVVTLQGSLSAFDEAVVIGVVIGLTDGGNGLEDCLLDEVFAKRGPQAVFILDFFHVCEHLCEFAQQAYSGDQIEEQSDRWCSMLKRRGGRAVLEEVKQLPLADCSEAVRESHRWLCGYLRNNVHRMKYPEYPANGWHIGSGSIELACKNLINARLNGTGMRWVAHDTDEMSHVRALFKSEPTAWDNYWSRPHPLLDPPPPRSRRLIHQHSTRTPVS